MAGMRDRWGLNERLFGFYYPIIVGLSELAGQRKTRRALLAQARGRTLEIGAGNGYNVPHYTSSVSELILTEPSRHLARRLRRRLESSAPQVGSWALSAATAGELPFPDESFDTVIGTYVLCTVPDPRQALKEIHRVLRHSGVYLFLEHVRAAEGTVTGVMQDVLAPVNRYFGAGCHPNRRTEQTIRDSPLTVDHLEHGTMPLAVPILRPTILGSAHR